jgi:crotonobetainyl-CoA:carnitine CoA-transferase CaiB-like acyl-CoA transferase
MQELPLEGIRVMDFGQMWAGPHLSQWLAGMGAEVIKVETSLRLDFMRMVGQPPALQGKGPNAGSAFASLNTGKKSIVLNMNMPRARELTGQLLGICDVVTENFGGSILERWGLSYEEMRKVKPGIIVYAGSGYGRSGPHKERPAYAEIVESFDGSTYANGYPGGEPATVGVSPWTDATQAMHGAFAILAALYHRSFTGEGQYIDSAMIEGSANFLGEMVMGYVMNGRLGDRIGNRDRIMAPHGCYRCAGEDEWVTVAVSGEREWKAFCSVIGDPEWTLKEEFNDELSRWKNQDELDQNVEQWTRTLHPYEIVEKLQKAGVMAGPSLSTKQAVEDLHLKEREFFVQADHPVLGRISVAGLPWRLSDSPRGNYSYPPLLGEHNDYVFGELLGLSREELEKLKEEKVFL